MLPLCVPLYMSVGCNSSAAKLSVFQFFFKKSIQTPKCAGSNGTNWRAVWHTQIDTLTSKNVCVVSIIIILISINSVYFKCSFAFTYSNALNDSGGPSDRAVSKAYVWGRSPAEIVGSSPTGDMDVCVL